jgi:hypothetical protein
LLKSIQNKKVINHYDIDEISNCDIQEDSILYIGQILTKEQIKESNANIVYDQESENVLNNLWQYLSNTSYHIYFKKHPGDESKYLNNLTVKYENFEMTENHIIPTLTIGHCSTLLIPYLQLNVPCVQVKHTLNDSINLSAYSTNKLGKIREEKDFSIIKELTRSTKNLKRKSSKSISQTLLTVIK